MALQLLEETARKHVDLRSQIGMVTVEAVTHESPDVQKQALALLWIRSRHRCPQLSGENSNGRQDSTLGS
jgi:hypothetical protein